MQLTNLKTNFLGKKYQFYEEIDSTQKEIWRLVKNNEIENGHLILANIQTAGIGTHGRVWHTDETENIAFSFYVETNCCITRLLGLTKEIAEILVEIFRDKYNINLDIKSPNDLMYNGKKLGGILTESKIRFEKIKYLVVGIGINTNKLHFSDDIKDIATSIKKEFNIDVDRDWVVSEFCNRFEEILLKRITKK